MTTEIDGRSRGSSIPAAIWRSRRQCAVDWDEYDFNLEDVVNASTGGSRHGSFDEKKWIAVIDALTDEPQSARAVARAAGVILPEPTFPFGAPLT